MEGLEDRRRRLFGAVIVLAWAILLGGTLLSVSPRLDACPPITQYTLDIIVEPDGAGYVELNPGGGEYSSGELVNLTAHVNPAPENYTFYEWRCAGEPWHGSTSPSITITMNSSKTVTAVFKLYVDVSKEGQGTASPPPGRHYFDKGDAVELSADADDTWEFIRWLFTPVGDPDGVFSVEEDPGSIFLGRSQSAITQFERQKYLSVDVWPLGTGTVARDPEGGWYDRGTKVRVHAQPAEGYGFWRWQDDLSGGFPHGTVFMDTDRSVIAEFRRTRRLTIRTVPDRGIVKAYPSDHWSATGPRNILFTEGTKVTLTAETPPYSSDVPGLIFAVWSGDVHGADNPINLIMDGDKSVTAHFREGAALHFPSGAGLITCSPPPAFMNVYVYGTPVTLTKKTTEGSDKSQWLVDGIASGRDQSITIIMDRNHSVCLKPEPEEPGPMDDTPHIFLSTSYTGMGTVLPKSGWYFSYGVPVVDPSLPSIWYPEETWRTTLNLVGIPASGWALREWHVVDYHEPVFSRENPYGLSIGSRRGDYIQACARFDRGFSLATAVVPDESYCRVDYYPDPVGGIEPGESTVARVETYLPGDVVTVAARQDGDFAFSEWLENGLHYDSSPLLTATMERDFDLVAVFEQGTRVKTNVAYDRNPLADIEAAPPLEWERGRPGRVEYTPDWPGGLEEGGSRTEVYLPGATVELLPVAVDGFAFSRWLEGNEYGLNLNTGPLQTLTVAESDLECTAVFKPGWIVDAWVYYDGEPSAEAGEVLFHPDHPGGRAAEALRRETYLDQSLVTLTASAHVGYVFVEWMKDIAGFVHDQPEYTFVVRDYHYQGENALQAHFTDGVVLTLTVSPREDCGAVIFTPDFPGGSHDGTERKETYLPDASVTFAAEAADGYHFVQWLCPDNPMDPIHGAIAAQQSVVMLGDKAYVAEFAPDTPVQLTLSVSGSGSALPGSGVYALNEAVELSALPAADAMFLHWEQVDPPGPDLEEAKPVVVMDQDRELRAVFVPKQLFTLTINTESLSPGASGWVASIPAGTGAPPAYPTQTLVRLLAQPTGTAALWNWSGPVVMFSGGDPAEQLKSPEQYVRMDANKTITARFEITYDVTVNAVPAELGGVVCLTQRAHNGRFWPNAAAQFEAIPRDGARFAHWKVDGQPAGSANPLALTVTDDISLDGYFVAQFELTLSQPDNGAELYVVSAVPPGNDGKYDDGTQITLGYHDPPSGTWRMDRWEVDGVTAGQDGTLTFVLSGDTSATLHLIQTFALSTDVQPVGYGALEVVSTPPANPDGRFDSGSSVQITPVPSPLRYFDHWTVNGQDIHDQQVLQVTIDEDTTVVAYWGETHTLNLIAQPTYGGVVEIVRLEPADAAIMTGDPPTVRFKHGTVVTLRGAPAPGYCTDSWSGATPVADPEPALGEFPDIAVLTLSQDTVVTVTFAGGIYDLVTVTPPPVQNDAKIRSDQPLAFTWTIQNGGPEDIPAEAEWKDAVYLSEDAFLDKVRDKLLVEFGNQGPLPNSVPYTNQVSSVDFPDVSPGSYWLIFVVNHDLSATVGLLLENNANNVFAVPVTVIDPVLLNE